MSESNVICCFCERDAGPHGNDPYPLQEEGRCCDTCNMTLVIKARIEREFNLLEKEDDAFYERRSAETNKDEANKDEANKDETNCECRQCMMKAYVHLDKDSQLPNIQSHDCVETKDKSVNEYDPSICEECGGYYKDHRMCHGMTREEIDYEDYVAEWSGPGNFGRGY